MSSGCGATPGGSTSCSGNGVCFNNSGCICNNDLFTGRSDWVNAEGKDCQILLPVIWAFWGLNLLVIFIVVVIAAPVLRRLWLHHSKVRENQKRKGHTYTIRENLGLFSILPYWFVSVPTHVAVAILQLVERDARLGLSLPLTVLWMLSKISNDLSASSARAALTISTMQSEGASPTAMWRREMLLRLFFGISVASSFMIWPVYATQGQDLPLAEGLFVGHFVISAIVAVFNAYISHGLAVSVNASLSESYEKLKDERILQVRNDLVRAQKTERNVFGVVSLCYLLLGVVPPLWTTYGYFWCTLWLLWPILGLRSVLTLESAQKSARGEKERNKLIADLQETAGGSRVRRGSVTKPTSPADLKRDFMSMWNQAIGISMKNIRTSQDPDA